MKKKLIKKPIYAKILLIVFFLITVNFFQNFFEISDPDYFWHHKVGEYIVENKMIPKTDLFSFSMPDFRWVNHEWLSDVLLYSIEKNFGAFSLSIFYLLMFGGICFFVLNKKRFNILDIIIVLAGVGALSAYMGVRQQMYSFLFFAVTLFIFKLKDDKFLWLLPLVFLAWANLHGGFVLGLLIATVLLGEKIFQKIKEKDKSHKIIIIIFLSYLATLVNPYGLRIYEEVFRTIGDSYLTTHIAEWMSLFYFVQARAIIFIAVFFSFLPEIKKRIPFGYFALSIFLFILSLKSVKYIPYFVIVSLPFLLDITSAHLDNSHKKFYKRVVKKPIFLPIAAFFCFVVFLFVRPEIIYKKVFTTSYPSKAISFLKERSEKNIFAYYGWSGYFIQKLPNKKYFIDGRMPSWKQQEKYAFKDFVDAYTCQNTEEILEKNHVDLIVWPVQGDEMEYITELNTVDLDWLAQYFAKEQKEACSFKERVSKNGWQTIYDDGDTLVFKK